MTTQDPVLSVWRRRRGRDTYIRESTVTTASVDAGELAHALRNLALVADHLGAKHNALEDRVVALEGIIVGIGSLRQKSA